MMTTPNVPRRLAQVMAARHDENASWPPIAAVLVSLRDQHAEEQRDWIERFPSYTLKMSLLASVLNALTFWRAAVDSGDDGDDDRERFERIYEALSRAMGGE